jgi:hypothetical protein
LPQVLAAVAAVVRHYEMQDFHQVVVRSELHFSIVFL